MTPLSAEERAYKEKTVEQLLANFTVLEARLARERRTEVIEDVQTQLEEIQGHVGLLQQELTSNSSIDPVADNLYRRVATALTNNKFFLAKKLLTKLETIEPFYPNIDRMRAEAEAGRASRRTQSVSKGGALPEIVLSPELVEIAAIQETVVVDSTTGEVIENEKTGVARYLQFHVVASCLIISLILCVMFGVGGITALQWLIEGG